MSWPDCRVCGSESKFTVTERWETEAGMSATDDAWLCGECVEDVSPNHSDQAYANYEFRAEPVPEAFGMSEITGGEGPE